MRPRDRPLAPQPRAGHRTRGQRRSSEACVDRGQPTSSETTPVYVPPAGFDGKLQEPEDAVKAGLTVMVDTGLWSVCPRAQTPYLVPGHPPGRCP